MKFKLICRPFKNALAALIASVLLGCTTVPETGRSQLNLFTPQQEAQMGISAFTDMKQEMPISHDPAQNDMVRRVGERIASVANLPNAQWEFVVFESDQANAFCLPGGKIGVYTGILPIAKNDAGLATVLGHEVAHAVARHGGERMTTAFGISLAGAGLSAAIDDQDPQVKQGIMTVYGLGSQLGLALPHSRTQESEADHLGLLYMARAGYNPEEATRFWMRFAEYNRTQGGSEGAWFLRTHPLTQTRIQNLESWMPQAKQEYEAARANQSR